MAMEYELEVSPVMSTSAALDYFAELLGCDDRFETPGAPETASRREVQVTVLEWAQEDDPELATLLDADRILKVGFRETKNLTPRERDGLLHDMVSAAVRLFENFPEALGTLSHQGEDIYLQRLGGEGIVLSERLRAPEYNRDHVLDELLERYPTRELGMVEDLLPE